MARLGKSMAASALLALIIGASPLLHAAQLKPEDEAALKARIQLPEGWAFSVYATGLGSPRLMQLASNGDLLVSVYRSGIIARVTADHDADGKADGVTALARGLNVPHGLLLENGTLYVAEEGQVTRYNFDGTVLTKPERIAGGIPAGGGHRSRTLKRGPDGKLYLSIGSSCNVCEEENEMRATIINIADGGQLTIHARGLRNTVGFDWQPGTGMLYGIDNGRDRLGDDVPPEELNLIVEGGHYGWPYRYGDNVPDPHFGARMPKTLDPLPPVFQFPAHVSPLAIRFLKSSNDSTLKTAALVTKHGSWNRSTPVGYEIASLHWDDDGKVQEQPFLTGCLQKRKVHCRPVDILEAPDGNLFVSDDFTGAIYRLTYRPLN